MSDIEGSYIDQADLEANFPATTIRQIFCDNGSGEPGIRLTSACKAASATLDSLLLLPWDTESVQLLVDNDPSIKYNCCRLAMALGCEGKPEWTGPDAPYQYLEKKAMDALTRLAAGASKSRGESVAGTNPNVRRRVRSPVTPAFQFAPSKRRPNPGGL